VCHCFSKIIPSGKHKFLHYFIVPIALVYSTCSVQKKLSSSCSIDFTEKTAKTINRIFFSFYMNDSFSLDGSYKSEVKVKKD